MKINNEKEKLLKEKGWVSGWTVSLTHGLSRVWWKRGSAPNLFLDEETLYYLVLEDM